MNSQEGRVFKVDSNGLQIVVNHLYCYVCAKYYKNKESFQQHQHENSHGLNPNPGHKQKQEVEDVDIQFKTDPDVKTETLQQIEEAEYDNGENDSDNESLSLDSEERLQQQESLVEEVVRKVFNNEKRNESKNNASSSSSPRKRRSNLTRSPSSNLNKRQHLQRQAAFKSNNKIDSPCKKSSTPLKLNNNDNRGGGSTTKLYQITQLISNLQNATMKILSVSSMNRPSCLEDSDHLNVTCNTCLETFTSLKRFHHHLNLKTIHNEENPLCTNSQDKRASHSSGGNNFIDDNIYSPIFINENDDNDDDDEDNNNTQSSPLKPFQRLLHSRPLINNSTQGESERTDNVQILNFGSHHGDNDDGDDYQNQEFSNSGSSSDNDSNNNDDEEEEYDSSRKRKTIYIIGKTNNDETKVKRKFKRCPESTPALRKANEEARRIMPNSDGLYLCPREGCTKTFRQRLGVKLHLMDHDGARPYKCSEEGCNRAYLVPRHLRAHIAKHHTPDSDKQFLCPACGQAFALKEGLDRHYRQKHEEKELKYKCTHEGCSKAYAYQGALKYHINTHADGPLFPCPACGKKFKQQNLLERHEIYLHRPVKLLSCTKCDKKFKFNRSLQDHIELHKEFDEEVAKGRIKLPAGMTNGNMTTEAAMQKLMHQYQRKKRFICTGYEDCTAAFVSLNGLRYHVADKHERKAEKSFKCTEDGCSQAYDKKPALKRHIEQVHAEPSFLCNHCAAAFKTSGALANHVASHTGEKNYFCDWDGCTYGSITHAAVVRHRVVHTNERAYKCTFCEKGFNHPVTLKRHILTHTGEKPHKCPHCPAAYPEKRNLKMHMKKHENETENDVEFKQEEDSGEEDDYESD